MNPNYAKKVKKEIDNLLKVGLIAVPKKNGKLRSCVDYRKLNAHKIKGPFPLPFIDFMLDQVASHEMYIFVDGYSGYNQLAIAPKDWDKTTFVTAWGVLDHAIWLMQFSSDILALHDGNLCGFPSQTSSNIYERLHFVQC